MSEGCVFVKGEGSVGEGEREKMLLRRSSRFRHTSSMVVVATQQQAAAGETGRHCRVVMEAQVEIDFVHVPTDAAGCEPRYNNELGFYCFYPH